MPADQPAGDNKVGGISLEPDVSYTAPDPLTYHPLTEEQIEVLCHGADDQSLNIALATLGAAAGLFQNVIDLIAAWSEGKAVAGRDLVLGCLCLALGGVGIAKITEWRRNRRQHHTLKSRILSRVARGRV